jgi:hypothetical protein
MTPDASSLRSSRTLNRTLPCGVTISSFLPWCATRMFEFQTFLVPWKVIFAWQRCRASLPRSGASWPG